MLFSSVQVMKKNRDPRWEKEFTWQLEDSPANDRLHIEVHSKGSSMNMVHRQVFPTSTSLVVKNMNKPHLRDMFRVW